MFGKPLKHSSNPRKSDVDAVNASNYLVRAESWIVLHPEVLQINNAEDEPSSAFSPSTLNTRTTQSGDSGEYSNHQLSQDPPTTRNNSDLASTSGTFDSSSWGTASEDCFSIDVNRGTKPPVNPNFSPSFKDVRSFNYMNPHFVSKVKQGSSPDRPSAFDLPLGSDPPGISPLTSPPVQVMQQDECAHDQERIPARVFAGDDSFTPAEWSAASADSLFSIQLGDHTLKNVPSRRTGEKSKESPNLSGESTFDLSVSSSPEAGQHWGNDSANKKGLEGGRTLEENYKKKKTKVANRADRDKVRLVPVSLPTEVFNNLDRSKKSNSAFPLPIEKSQGSDWSCCGACSWVCCCVPSCWSCSWLCCKSCREDSSRLSSTILESNSHAKSEKTSRSHKLDLKAGSSVTSTKSEAACFSCFACFSCSTCLTFLSCQHCCCSLPSCPSCCSLPSCSSCCSLPSCPSCCSCFSFTSCASSFFSCNFCSCCCCCRSH